MEQSNAKANLENQLRILLKTCKEDYDDLESAVKRTMNFINNIYDKIEKLVDSEELNVYIYNTYYSNLLVEFHSGYIDSKYLDLLTRRKIFKNVLEYIDSDKFKLKIMSRILNYYHKEVATNG